MLRVLVMHGKKWSLCFLIALLYPLQAKAGAWLQNEGRGQVIFASSVMLADHRFDHKGQIKRSDRFIKQESRTLIEYGIAPEFTVFGTLAARSQSFETDDGLVRNMATALGGGLRARLWQDHSNVLSVQASAEGRYERALGDVFARLDPRLQTDIRLLAGHNFTVGNWSAFVEAQAGWRWRGSGFANEAVLDVTLGLRPHPAVLLMFQSFNTAALAKEPLQAQGKTRQHKLQLSAAFDVTRNITAQVGVFTSVDGRNSLREQGGLLALWRKF